VFIRPSAIGPLADDKRHWVAFQTTPRLAVRCSEPHTIDVTSPEALFQPQRAAEFRRRHSRSLPESYGSVAEELLGVYERRRQSLLEHDRLENIRRVRERRSAPEFARLIARTLFQCELLVLPS